MSATTSSPNVNPRPIRNEYCIMTTVHMLELRKESYLKTLNKLEHGRDGLTDRYYDLPDIPREARDEITRLNLLIDECTGIVDSIDRAIKTIACTATPPLTGLC